MPLEMKKGQNLFTGRLISIYVRIIRIKNNGNKELSTSGFLGVTCISWSRVYTAPLRPMVLVRPLKFHSSWFRIYATGPLRS